MQVALVAAVLAIVAAIAGPRMSSAASAPHSASRLLVGQLRSLRTAIDAYAADHYGRWPGGDVTRITRQLTEFSNRLGDVSPSRTERFRFGPYLKEIPVLPVGTRKGSNTLGLSSQEPDAAWMYQPQTGQIWANTWPGESDEMGRDYVTY